MGSINSFYPNNIYWDTDSSSVNSVIFNPPEFDEVFRKNWPHVEKNKFYSEEEALSILFSDREKKQELKNAKIAMERDLLRRIRDGKVNRIRGYRVLGGLSQKELSLRTGIPQGNISNMENNKHKPLNSTLKKIALVLNVDFKELIP